MESIGRTSLCALCASRVTGESALCAYHPQVHGDDWAIGNRIMCDFLHRGKIPRRLPECERDNESRVRTQAA